MAMESRIRGCSSKLSCDFSVTRGCLLIGPVVQSVMEVSIVEIKDGE